MSSGGASGWSSAEGQDEFLRLLLRTTPDAVIVTDAAGSVLLINRAAERMFACTGDEVLGQDAERLIPGAWNDLPALQPGGCSAGQVASAEFRRTIRARRGDGSGFPAELAMSGGRVEGRPVWIGWVRELTRRVGWDDRLRPPRGEIDRIVAARTADLRAANRRLEQLARVDALTRIANRRAFDEALAREVHRAGRAAAPVALILCDIDRFKSFNDHYGHLAGDACLRRVAGAIGGLFARGADVTARFGGEEFAVLLPGTGLGDAMRMAESMRARIRRLELPPAPAACLTVSAGVASLVPTGARDMRQLLRAADRALYRAKRAGRDRVLAATVRDAQAGPAPEAVRAAPGRTSSP